MGIVRRGGSTALSLAQVTRASVIVVLSHFLFCASDARQCLDRAGASSAALVVAGGALFAVAKNRAGATRAATRERRSPRSVAAKATAVDVDETKRRATPRATRRHAAAKK